MYLIKFENHGVIFSYFKDFVTLNLALKKNCAISKCNPAHTVRNFRNITGQNRSPIFRFVVLIHNAVEHYGKKNRILHGVLLRADLTRHGHPIHLGRKGLDGRALLGHSSKGHPSRILILFP